MNLFEKYEANTKAEMNGVEVVIDDCTFTIRRAGGSNKSYRYLLATMSLNYPILQDDDAVMVDKFDAHEQLLMNVFSESVLADWSGVDDRDGKPMVCTPENVLDLLTSCPSIWDKIKDAALDDDLFALDNAKEDGEALGK